VRSAAGAKIPHDAKRIPVTSIRLSPGVARTGGALLPIASRLTRAGSA